ncbi:ATP/maltotriose-dependent transcriptional regulator MalT [Rhodoblastus sphagnicola]|nr:hypothetical protein [Rhodoblastus sphagnicola]MBB4200829.1 ATP/maltotriose-dependent transcriptional regulator MalT [Rhodoblastus sphagnicola]
MRTRLFPPMRAGGVVPRPRLERMAEGLRHKTLTIARAPAGYGKSTLLAQWFDGLRGAGAGAGAVAGWVSLDEAADDLASFFNYAVEAIRGTRPTFGRRLSALLQGPRRLSLSEVVSAFVNGLLSEDDDIFLFIDDLHLATEVGVVEAFARIVAHPPANLHLVLASRHAPPFSVSRLRAKGGLAEVDMSSLRFDPEEAADFLQAAGHADLSDHEIGALVSKTEGWVAGMQLASISLDGRDSIQTIIENISGDHRYISEHLADDVLVSLPPHTLDFMLSTSILPRFCAELCDALTGAGDAREQLDRLERQELFILSLDHEGVWYRYHHLFSKFLRRKLCERDPGAARRLHRLASHWFVDHGMAEDAFNHAIEGSDVVWAAELLDRYCSMLMYQGGISTLHRWEKQIPADVLRKFPRSRLEIVFSILIEWRFEEAERIISDVEALMKSGEAVSASGIGLDAIIAHRKMIMHHFMDQPLLARAIASELMKTFPDGDAYLRGNIATVSIFAHRETFHLDEVGKFDIMAKEDYRRAASKFVDVWHDTVMGPTCFQRGAAETALHRLADAKKSAEEVGGRLSPLAAMPALVLAEVHYEQNDVDAASELVERYGPEAEKQGFVDHLVAYYVTRIRLAGLRGDEKGASDAIWQAKSLAQKNGFVRLRRFIDHERGRLSDQANDLDALKRFIAGVGAEDIERLSRPGHRTTTGDWALALSWCRAITALREHGPRSPSCANGRRFWPPMARCEARCPPWRCAPSCWRRRNERGESRAGVAQLVLQEHALEIGVERDHDRAKAADPEPDADEIQAVGDHDRDTVAGADAQVLQKAGDASGLGLGLRIGERTLVDHGDKCLVTARPRLKRQDFRQDPVRAVPQMPVHGEGPFKIAAVRPRAPCATPSGSRVFRR